MSDRAPQLQLDPFALTADPALYLPREASERALARMLALLRAGRRPVALSGPPGLGKTLLLHVLRARLAGEFRGLYLPYPALSPRDLCGWALQLLGLRRGRDPEQGLVMEALHRAAEGAAVLLLIDDGGSMPLRTARRIGELVRAAEGALRIVLATSADRRAARVLAALAPAVEEVLLDEPFTEAETRALIEARLEAAQLPPALRARFSRAALARIHAQAKGNPRTVLELATALWRSSPSAEGETRAEGSDASAARVDAGADEGQRATAADPGEAGADEAEGAAGEGEAVREDASAPPRARAKPRQAAGRQPGAWWARMRASARHAAVGSGWGERTLLALAVGLAAVAIPLLRPTGSGPPAVSSWPQPEAAARGGAAPPDLSTGRETASGAGAEQPGRGTAVRGTRQEREETLSRAPGSQGIAAEAPGARRSRAQERPGPGSASGLVRVNVNAFPWAEIEIDGIAVGETPLADLPLRPGEHLFRARMPDGRVIERRVEVAPDRRYVTFR